MFNETDFNQILFELLGIIVINLETKCVSNLFHQIDQSLTGWCCRNGVNRTIGLKKKKMMDKLMIIWILLR